MDMGKSNGSSSINGSKSFLMDIKHLNNTVSGYHEPKQQKEKPQEQKEHNVIFFLAQKEKIKIIFIEFYFSFSYRETIAGC